MKWLTRLRLINWHYFQDESLTFGKQTLIVGKSGAGKSTIIDAMQVLFVADQRQIRFNSAAHENAKRDLRGYLKGKIGDDERMYVRDQTDFTSYLLAEFWDDEQQDAFVVGYVADVHRDGDIADCHFILNGIHLDALELVKSDGKLRNRDEFCRFYGEFDPGASASSARYRPVFERNKSQFQRALLNRFGQLRDRFFSVFTKAIAFRPIQNVRHFVEECILDARELELGVMRENFEYHEKYRRELEELERRREDLLRIREAHAQYVQLRELTEEQEYVVLRLIHQEAVEAFEEAERRREEAEQGLARWRERRESFAAQKLEAEEHRDAAYRAWQNDDGERRRQTLAERLAGLEEERSRLEAHRTECLKELRRWKRVLAELAVAGEAVGGDHTVVSGGLTAAPIPAEAAAALEAAAEAVERGESDAGRLDGLGARLREAGGRLAAWREVQANEVVALRAELEQLDARIAELDAMIEGLRQKRRPYRKELLNLKRLLEERLGPGAKVRVFCEEMEIVDETWRDAVEGYLHTQRFDLLVDPDRFEEALALYEREKRRERLDGVGLVDTEKERVRLGRREPGSLAEAVAADDPVVRAHADNLLGRVMKAKDERELRLHHTAVTATCMLYHHYVARQIPRERYEIPYIGAKAIERQLEIRLAEREETARARDRLARRLEEAERRLRAVPGEPVFLFERLAERIGVTADIARLDERIADVRRELGSLDLRQAERLRAEYERWVREVKRWDERLEEAAKEIGRHEIELRNAETDAQRLADRCADAEAAWRRWTAVHGEEAERRALVRWEDALRQDGPTSRKRENWDNNRKGNVSRREKQWEMLKDLRRRFNIVHHFDGPAEDEDNARYDELLHNIEHLDIPKYRDKVREALRDAEEQFKSQFVYKLREAIHDARREFRELNAALEQFSFSSDRYRFELAPSERYRKFYDAVMDPRVMEEGSLFDVAGDERQAVLQDLFDRLIRGEAGDMEEFTDYRRYLDYDIVVTSGDARYRFSQVLREKSGGETQTPFYIAILASFHHLYASPRAIRLAVFDEAFSKMDEDRIRASLRLIRRMNLQLVLAAPDEKLQIILPEVSTVNVVTRIGHRCFVDLLEHSAGRQEFADEAGGAVAGAGKEAASEQGTLF
ncbi:MAG: hypothetical protein BLM47_11590 [Candidatus Reconcilbacillus cellulovorans]|uniref:ATPase n=1 Tax=Candidatus Reconcilbacillus cellulovorans TaxID=1906605 RepID=A0A2A6DYK7_9BACL|nr:MAG: hypothetical protein BLM47_11590 [Candidatus Reconcilbacillus cellulovorans]